MRDDLDLAEQAEECSHLRAPRSRRAIGVFNQ